MWALLLLGALQGLTEFLPVSSSGHLIVLKSLFGVRAPGAALEVALHLGTLAAVLFFYRGWLLHWVGELAKGGREAWVYLGRLALASTPAGLLGLLFGHAIEAYFTVPATAIGWLSTALVLWFMPDQEEGTRTASTLEWGWVSLIGCAQALALWPGVSRSASTIAMGRLVGLKPDEAVRFSFFMAIPAVLGALVFEIPSLGSSGLPLLPLALSASIAAATGVVAIQWITSIVNRPGAWRGFAVYLVGVVMAVWIVGG